MIELKNSKIQYLGKASGRDRYMLEAFIGAVQMREPEGQWQDIRPCLIRDTDGWHVAGTPYYAEIKDDGSRLFCPDRNERNKYLRLLAPPLFTNLSRNVIQNPDKLGGSFLPNQITMPADWGEMRIIFSNTGMHFEILFAKTPPSTVFGKDSPRILLNAETAGLDVEQLLESKAGIGIPRPRLIADDLESLADKSQDRWLDWKYKNGQLELGFDLGDLPFPILLKNTTVDVQVEASGDDGHVYFWGGISTAGTTTYVGDIPGVRHAFYRFDGITIPQSSTIGVCKITAYEYDSTAAALTKIYFEKSNDPDPPADWDDYNSRALTAGVDWDGDPGDPDWYDSPSLVTPMQELIDAYGLSNQAIQVMHKDDGSSGGFQRFRSWDYGDNSYGVKLYIEYTAGGVTSKTATETGTGADVSSLLADIIEGDAAGGSEGIKGRGVALKDNGGGVDALTALFAGVLAGEAGSGIEQSTLTSLVAKLSAEAGSGIDTAGLTARLASSETGTGADTGMIPGQKNLFDGDGGIGRDILKSLIGTSATGSDMKLPGRQGHVRIPSKGVSL